MHQFKEHINFMLKSLTFPPTKDILPINKAQAQYSLVMTIFHRPPLLLNIVSITAIQSLYEDHTRHTVTNNTETELQRNHSLIYQTYPEDCHYNKTIDGSKDHFVSIQSAAGTITSKQVPISKPHNRESKFVIEPSYSTADLILLLDTL